MLASGAVIQNSQIAGANSSNQSTEIGVVNFGGSSNVVTLKHDYIYNCGECLNTGSWNVSDSYIQNNGMYGTNDHLEAVYIDGSGNTVTINHSTLLSPPGWNGSGSPNGGQAGLLFGDTNGGSGGACSTQWNITNDLLAGDGFTIYECGNASSVGSAQLTLPETTSGDARARPIRTPRDSTSAQTSRRRTEATRTGAATVTGTTPEARSRGWICTRTAHPGPRGPATTGTTTAPARGAEPHRAASNRRALTTSLSCVGSKAPTREPRRGSRVAVSRGSE